MALEIPEIEPDELRAGDTVQWTKDLSDNFPADDGWSLAYTLINQTGKQTISASASGKKFSITVPATTTANYVAGTYTLIGRVSKAGAVHTVYTGTLVVLPDLAQATTHDIRSHTKKVLDALEAALEGRATRTELSYSIAGRSISSMNHEQLLEARDRVKREYENELASEHFQKTGINPRRIGLRFNRV